jgi:hypothetical protein
MGIGYVGQKFGEAVKAFKEGFNSVKPSAPSAPTAGAQATQGQAIVMVQKLENGPHATIAVQHGNQKLHTEQLTDEVSNATTIAPAVLAPGPVKTATLTLPDAASAMAYQRSVIGKAMGTYDPNTNSCATHVGDALRAGGLPAPNTTREIGKYVRRASTNTSE